MDLHLFNVFLVSRPSKCFTLQEQFGVQYLPNTVQNLIGGSACTAATSAISLSPALYGQTIRLTSKWWGYWWVRPLLHPSHACSFKPLWNRESLPLLVFVDLGADANFMNSNLASQAGIPDESLASPFDANTLDGRLLARVTHQTNPVVLIFSGNYHEQLWFHLFFSPHATIILGQPWLKLHNPHLDWSSGKVVCWSSFSCHSCLQSALKWQCPPTYLPFPKFTMTSVKLLVSNEHCPCLPMDDGLPSGVWTT